MGKDAGLEGLLDLDGELFPMPDGTWCKFVVSRTEPTPERPAGIRYSLTYHGVDGRRILGFDNAHAVAAGRRAKLGDAVDHRHRWPGDRGLPYRYESADKLYADFTSAVNRYIKEKGETRQ